MRKIGTPWMRALWCIALLALGGCSNLASVPTLQSQRGDRIGILVETSALPVHTHIGTTVFNNFEKTYPYGWRLQDNIRTTVGSAMAARGFTVVDLRAAGLRHADAVGLVERKEGDAWRIVPGRERVFARLRQEMGLRAVIAVKDKPSVLFLYQEDRRINGPGLYTRGMFASTRYMGVAPLEWTVTVLDPPVDLAQTETVGQMARLGAYAPLGDFEAKNYQAITPVEFQTVQNAILQKIRQTSEEIARELNPR